MHPYPSAALLPGVGSLNQAQPWGVEGAATLTSPYTDVMKMMHCGLTAQEGNCPGDAWYLVVSAPFPG